MDFPVQKPSMLNKFELKNTLILIFKMEREFITKFQYDLGQLGVKALLVASALIIVRLIV